MMTEKRYYQRDFEELYYIIDSHKISEKDFDEKVEYDGYNAFEDSLTGEEIVKLLNENEQLKEQLKEYHNAFDCSQCRYHNYDWFDDGDEFEVCDKRNNEALMYNHSCKDWEEL